VTGRPARPERGSRRRSWREIACTSLDFETTGLDPARDAVISYGVVPVEEGRVLLRQSEYRTVRPHVAPSTESVKVHHLRAQDLEDAPPLDEVLEPLRVALDGRYLLAWAAGVEIGFLRRLYGGRDRWWRRRTVDVLHMVVALDELDGGRADDYRLEAAAARFGVPVEEAHHALDDAVMTAELFLIVATKLAERGYPTIGSLVRAS
jgi:DNA polymerase III subunit epsilon